MSDSEQRATPEPIFNMPPVVFNLLMAMLIVFVGSISFGAASFSWTLYYLGFIPARYALGPESAPLGWLGLIWPFFTHLFVHGGALHLLVNSVWLLAFGSALARRMGTWPFLGFYFACGIGGALLHLVLHFGEAIPVVGASGAISGCMGGAIRLMFSPSAQFFVVRGTALGQVAPIWDRRVLTFTTIWLVINYLFGSGIVPMPGAEGQSIAWEAHVGGYVSGLLLFSLFDRFSSGFDNMFRGFEEPPYR